jgi:hypothetical protein
MAGRLITPDELRRISEQKELKKMREALEPQGYKPRVQIMDFRGGVGIFLRW